MGYRNKRIFALWGTFCIPKIKVATRGYGVPPAGTPNASHRGEVAMRLAADEVFDLNVLASV